MMRKTTIISYVGAVAMGLVMMLLVGCHEAKRRESARPVALEGLSLMDTLQMRPAMLKALRAYAADYPSHNSYIIDCTYLHKYEGVVSNGCNDRNDIFCVLPAYRMAFDGGEWSVGEVYPGHYFVLAGKTFFVTSRNDAFLRQTPLEKAYNRIVKEEQVPRYDAFRYLLVVHGCDSVQVLPGLYGEDIRPLRLPVRKFEMDDEPIGE